MSAGFPPIPPTPPAPPALAADVWIVSAAYREAEAIASVITALLPSYPNVVVVDDGSPDDTAAVAKAAGATVLCHAINLGQGAALQTGIDYALSRGAAYIVTFDSDGQHRVADIETLLAPLRAGQADIVFGSRFLGSAPNLPLARRVTLKLAVLFTFLTSGLRMTDAHNGLRALTRHAASKIRIRHDGMAHASEFIAQTRAHRLRWTERPVTILYTDYSLAKGQRLSNSFRIIADLIGGKIHH